MLNQISLFRELTPESLFELKAISIDKRLNSGETLFHQGEPVNHFYVVSTGGIQISKKINNRDIAIATYEKDTFFGEVPILAGTNHVATGKAISDTHLYLFEEEDFWLMLLTFSSVRKIVLGHMANRNQELQMLSQRHEKLIGLGTLAAGLAHELNNPASAACGAVGQLKELFLDFYFLILKNIERCLTPVQLEYLLKIKREASEYITKSKSLNPLEQLDLEDEITIWLEAHDISDGWRFAPNLVAGGVTTKKLTILSQNLPTNTLSYIITCLDLNITQTSLLTTLEESSSRISQIVSSVKSYSYVDQAPLKKRNIDVNQGLENTLTILNYKLKKNNTWIFRNYADELPLIVADGSSLNQVWTNLIDNAIDALANHNNGKIVISTSLDQDFVVVEIADNGAGIPPDIQSRIFEPFFTTKEIGQGTGIGLDLVYRIVVAEHHGSITCCSEPGSTKFHVKLPINPSLITKER